MSFQKKRQLNEEETRIYAAGMNAARRGEYQPKEWLAPEQYKFWRWGWNRMHRPVYNTPIRRSTDHNTWVEGRHCIHTECETLDDALKVLAIKQRAKKASATMKARPQNLRQQMGLHRGRLNSPIGKAIAPAQKEAASEFEQHIVGRVVMAIGSLKTAVEEMSVISALGHKFPAVNPKSLMNIIETLSHLIRQDTPMIAVQRAPVRPAPRLCVSCGAELAKNQIEYCLHCNPATESQRVAAKLLREHHARLAGLRHEVNEVEKLTYKISRRVIDHDDSEGHGGHPSQAAGDLAAGGRQEDIGSGSETPHQPGTGGAGDAEG